MAKKEKARELTKAEQKRKEFFEEQSRKLEEQGYTRKDLTFGVVAANVWAIVVTLPLIVPFLLAYRLIWGKGELDYRWTVLYGLIIFALIVVHELIHGAVFACFTKEHFRSVSFGVIWSMLTPYCTCREPLKRAHYLLAILAPTVVLGVLPAVIALACGFWGVLLLGVLMILGGGGDIMCAFRLLTYKAKGKDCVFFDHPYEVGLVVFERAKTKK